MLNNYRKLNKTYQFTVTVTDGISLVKRSFSSFIVSDTFVKADNEIMKASNGVFTADATDTRVPIWLTAADLGRIRANNYATLFFDVEDQNSARGTVSYVLEGLNDDGTNSIIPSGLKLDIKTGEIAGIIPYKPAVSEDYKFTLSAIRTTSNDGVVTVFVTASTDILAGKLYYHGWKITVRIRGRYRRSCIISRSNRCISRNKLYNFRCCCRCSV